MTRARNQNGGVSVATDFVPGYARRASRSRVVLGAVLWALFFLVLFGVIR